MLGDELLVLDQLVLKLLLEVAPLRSGLRQAVDHIDHQVEAIQLILHPYVKRRRDGTLFLVTPHVEIAIGATVGQPVNKPWVPVEAKYDVLVFGEERIVIRFTQSVRMLARRL